MYPGLPQTSKIDCFVAIVNVALSGPRQFLAAESNLNLMKNVFYFTLKALFVLKILNCPDFFGHVVKQLD